MSYRVETPPQEYEPSYVQRELEKVEKAFDVQDVVRLAETAVAPAKPREGQLRFADGVNWNPGSGRGIYAFYSGVWNKL